MFTNSIAVIDYCKYININCMSLNIFMYLPKTTKQTHFVSQKKKNSRSSTRNIKECTWILINFKGMLQSHQKTQVFSRTVSLLAIGASLTKNHWK